MTIKRRNCLWYPKIFNYFFNFNKRCICIYVNIIYHIPSKVRERSLQRYYSYLHILNFSFYKKFIFLFAFIFKEVKFLLDFKYLKTSLLLFDTFL